MAVIFVIIWSTTGGNQAPCDQPLPWFLYLGWIVGFSIAGFASAVLVYVNLTAKGKTEKGHLIPSPFGKSLLCLLVIVPIFVFVWYVYGNVWLWSTFPSNNATNQPRIEPGNKMEQGTIALGLGCSPDLYNAVKGYMIFTYVIAGLIVLLLCCCCCCMCLWPFVKKS